MSSSRRRKASPALASFVTVEGRVFSSRAEAVAYCKVQRLSIAKIEPVSKVFPTDPVKLSLGSEWRLRLFFNSSDPVLICEHAAGVHAFTVRMSDLVDLVSTIKARVRELSKAGALL